MTQAEETATSTNGAQLPHPADAIVCYEPLGAIYIPDATEFRVWAPTAYRVTLRLYETPVGGHPRLINLTRRRDGAWDTTLLGDWKGAYYTYTAEGHDPRFDPNRELVDPYARAVTAHDGRAIVVDDRTPVADRPVFPVSEAIIYEMHLRDFTVDPDSGIQRRGRYLGLTEAGTHLTARRDVPTGIDHLVELGINVVQLMPICEFHSEESHDHYGWGYDTVHFQSPDGWYATERWDARRVTEVKRMVDALHRRGIRVTLDMVFNHTFESFTKHRIYSFEGLVPGYYYRLRPDGSYWNGSGTGNEFRTEAPMARRFLLDTVRYWLTEYKVDGFRFDLLGLIDVETMVQIVKVARAIDPHVLLYGEPWAGGSTPIEINGKGRQRGRGWAVFNDHFRDALKGNVFDARAKGFIQSGTQTASIKRGVRGSIEDFADSPLEAVNYAECHDNHTLWDRIVISTIDTATITDADRRAMNGLAAAAIFTSQGIPFIQSGQEFLRRKSGDHNSYDKPDAVNMIRWSEKAKNRDVYSYYRGLIAIRRAHPLFRLETADEVRAAVDFLDDHLDLPAPDGCVGYQILDVTGRDSWTRALVLLNGRDRRTEFTIPPGAWEVYADDRRAKAFPLDETSAVVNATSAEVAPHSALILGEPRNSNGTNGKTNGKNKKQT
ncbi:MAG: type I pullulanase [Blastocatellales bacterium]|nr:type I pullulanase [Blastocatellales bacterium]